jgi:hypothetical protein
MCNGIETSCTDTKKFFLRLEAFEGGAGEKLYGLNRLDNSDKHVQLTPIMGIAKVGEI